ncbi:MAG: N-acetylmuramoyl-L-alanine amidase, partial [Candidatus Binataceae bacterium]
AVTGATIENQGGVIEFHFAVRGRGLEWHLTTHGQELWIDLDHVRMDLPPRPLTGQEQPPVTGLRTIDGGGGSARIVVEVIGRDDYAIARLPHELVLRLAPAGSAADLAGTLLMRLERQRQHQPPYRSVTGPIATQDIAAIDRPIAPASSENNAAFASPERSELAAYRLRPPVAAIGAPTPSANSPPPLVVIDPGHGGHDPGTAAADGTPEKNVALAIAMRLRSALGAAGLRAELTRGDDTFVALRDRTASANQAGADLFVSIHLNSSPDSATTGIETYYLNNTTDRATIRLARMENGVAGGYSLSGSPDLNYILTDMRQQYKANESASLARMIEAEAAANISASLGIEVNALGAKQGPFYVLVGAMMPAVLVECGFLSNANEAQLLESPRYQQALADGIAHAVTRYFNADASVGNL